MKIKTSFLKGKNLYQWTLLVAVISLIILSPFAYAQTPEAFTYQAAARDNSGNGIANQAISLRFSIHDVTANGMVLYRETQNTTTTSLGLFSVNIGQGTPVTGTFASINWSTNSKFLQVEMDATGGTNYVDMGTTQMLSVPYALYAGSSNASSNGVPNGIANGNTLRWNGSAWVVDSTLTNKQSNIGIGTTSPSSSALLDLSSTSKGFIMPKMTTAQRDAIVSPVVGLQIFNTDDQCINIYDGAYWIETCGLKVTGTGPVPGTNVWVQKAVFVAARASAAGFSIGSKGYIGMGSGPAGLKNDFWEYDPVANIWTQKADFGGTGRYETAGFSIGSKGYIGTGIDASGSRNDFWEYDPDANSWTQKANFGGVARWGAVGFSIGSKGYIGTGFPDSGPLKNDFWEYDPAANTWTQKANFGGVARYDAAGFSIGSKGYIGTGIDGSGGRNDFWEYDPAANTWTQKAKFGGVARWGAVGFSIGSKGYIGTGFPDSFPLKNDFWEYDLAANTWTQKTAFGGVPRYHAVGFSIGNKGYIGTGTDGSNKNDFWEFTQDVPGNIYSSTSPASITTSSVSDGAWTQNGTTVYNSNSGNVGIGTSFPSNKLTVSGIADFTGNVGVGTSSPAVRMEVKDNLRVSSSNATTLFQAYGAGLDGSTNQFFAISADVTNGLLFEAPKNSSGTNQNINFTWRGLGAFTSAFFISGSTANVGINTLNPAAKLDVAGSTKTSTLQVTTGAINGYLLRSDASGNTSWANPTTITTGSAANFTGNLAGDVSGTQSATSVNRIKGVTVSATAPTTNQYLRYNGSSWSPGAVALSTDVSGTLPVANGGTNNSTVYTSGSIVFSNGTSLTQNNSALYWDNTNMSLGIGTTSPDNTLTVNGSADKPGGGSWGTFSDERLKKNITSFNYGLNIIDQIHPVSFQYNGKGGYAANGKTYVGIIAQDMQKIAPYMITTVNKKLDASDTVNTDLLMYDPSALDYILVNAVKELSAENESLKKQNEMLASEISLIMDVLKKDGLINETSASITTSTKK